MSFFHRAMIARGGQYGSNYNRKDYLLPCFPPFGSIWFHVFKRTNRKKVDF